MDGWENASKEGERSDQEYVSKQLREGGAIEDGGLKKT